MKLELFMTEKEATKFIRKKLKELFKDRKKMYQEALEKLKNISKGDELHISYTFKLIKGWEETDLPKEPEKPKLRELTANEDAPIQPSARGKSTKIEAEDNRVYCKDCKYLRIEKDDFMGACFCDVVYPVIHLTVYSDPNKNNDCEDYKRKWWKFWL